MADFAARNDARAQRIIKSLYAEQVSPENIARLLNYHFDNTFLCTTINHKPAIQRVPDGHNYAPNVTIWSAP